MSLVSGMGRRAARSWQLARHRLRVGHGIPEGAVDLIESLSRAVDSRFSEREEQRVRREADAVRHQYEGRPLSMHVSRLPIELTDEPVELAAGGFGSPLSLTATRLSAGDLSRIASSLRSRGLAAARSLSISTILDVLDAASTLWLDPGYPRRALAIESIHRHTGFSREMIIHSIDLEMRSSRRFDLWRTLLTELGNPQVLDRPVWAPTGEARRAMVFGPRLLTAVFSSNIPALPHLTYMRALAVKSPVLAKVASHEPIFASLYVDTLIDLCPRLKDSLAAVWFPGGTEDLERAMHAHSEFLVAYGSDESLLALASKLPPGIPRLLHSHRMGVGVLERSAAQDPSRWAEAVAYDFSAFDGQACLAPATYFVEASRDEAVALGRAIGAASNRIEQWLPRRMLEAPDAAARRLTVERWHARSIFDVETTTLLRGSEPGPSWACLVTAGDFHPQQLGDRLFHLHCVKDLAEVEGNLEPFSQYLQNVAVAGEASRTAVVVQRLAGLGASRSTRPGWMPTPSMMWHHDGHACIAELVRWSDLGA